MTPPPSPQGRCAPRTRRHLQAQHLRKGRCSIRRTPSHSPGPQVLRALRTGQCWTPGAGTRARQGTPLTVPREQAEEPGTAPRRRWLFSCIGNTRL